MIQPNCRAQFTADDFQFIVQALSRDEQQKVSLVELLTDSETRDDILDHEELTRAVLENPKNLTISAQFYFYILARLSLKKSGISERILADYIAAMLVEFSRTHSLESPLGDLKARYVSDVLLALRDANSYETFLIRAHVGNYALFVTGLFHENIEKRRQRGAPSCTFYEEMGRQNFMTVAFHDVAKRYELTNLFQMLAEQFHQCRVALNQLGEELLDLGDHRYMPKFG
jgi:hypothetical protein